VGIVDKRLVYSYDEQRKQRRRLRVVLICVLIFFALYVSFTSFLFSMRVIKSNSMQPSLHAGDHFIFSSYLLYSPELHRGSIVLVDMGEQDKRTIISKFFDGVVRFFTFQWMGISKREDYFYMKRVIALPGDEVSKINFVIRVKPKESPYQVTEFESSERHYEVMIPQIPALWDNSLPFSGNMDKIVLGDNECILLSDDRSNTNDSRAWGTVPIDRIMGRALFRYWPLTRIGRP
jgi:signal peptidase I